MPLFYSKMSFMLLFIFFFLIAIRIIYTQSLMAIKIPEKPSSPSARNLSPFRKKNKRVCFALSELESQNLITRNHI